MRWRALTAGPAYTCVDSFCGCAALCCAPRRDWNPASDEHLPQNYNITNFKAGKRACKMALQEELGLPVNADTPLIAFIGRLDYQKGADIVLQVCCLMGV
jgi:glycogen synthase